MLLVLTLDGVRKRYFGSFIASVTTEFIEWASFLNRGSPVNLNYNELVIITYKCNKQSPISFSGKEVDEIFFR